MPRKSKAAEGITLNARIGRNIKAARTRLSMTQGQLAEAIDIETVSLSRIETGAQLPSLDRIQHIADVLEVPISALVAECDDHSAIVQTLAKALKDLPSREQAFICDLVLSYTRHWTLGQQD